MFSPLLAALAMTVPSAPNPSPASPDPASPTYHWRSVAIGGGGYVTGLAIHPREPGLVYARTDVGGLYRWHETGDAQGRHWIPLTDHVGWEEREFQSIDGLALDPHDPERIYLAVGNGDHLPSDVLASTDRGDTWQRTHLDRTFIGNGGLRWGGERLVVDPHRPGRVYAGTRLDGLWVNDAAGSPGAWSRLEALPPGAAHVLIVLCDPATPDRLYVGAAGGDLFRSDDAGASWQRIGGGTTGGPSAASRAVITRAGVLYVTTRQGLFRYTPDEHRDAGTWTDLTPHAGANDWCALAVSDDPEPTIVVGEYYYGFDTPLWISTAGGAPGTWRETSFANGASAPHGDVPWHRPEMFAAATSALVLDPHQPGRVWLSDWYAIWRTEDVHAQPIVWRTHQAGHEEVVNLSLAVPSGPAHGTFVYSGHADIGGFAHRSVDTFPTHSLRNVPGADPALLVEITGIAAAERDPATAAFIGASSWDDEPKHARDQRGALFFTHDGGTTLQRAAGYPEAWRWGRVALSAGDPANVVVVARGGDVQASTDAGATFTPARGAPTAAACGIRSHIFNRIEPLAADRVRPDVFYLFSVADGRLHASEDGGLSWEPRGQLPACADEASHPRVVGGQRAVFVVTAPGHAGHVWVSLHDAGLYVSQDGGYTFTCVHGVTTPQAFAIGRARDASAYPALYAFARGPDGLMNFHRSDDAGVTWARINDGRHRWAKTLRLAADRQVYGRIYLGTGGRGLLIGDLPTGSAQTERR